MIDNKSFRRLVFLVVGAIILCWAIFNFHIVFDLVKFVYGLVFPFVLGGIIAFVLNLPLRSIEKHMIRLFTTKKRKPKVKTIRPFSITITLIVVLSIVIGIIGIIIPLAGQALNDVTREVPYFLISCQQFLQKLATKMPDIAQLIGEFSVDWQRIIKSVTDILTKVGSTALNSSVSLATGVFGGIVNFILAFIFALYLLAQKEKVVKTLSMFAKIYIKERNCKQLFKFLRLSNVTFSNFVSGQCIEACILGALVFVAMVIFGFPYAALISVIVAITALIPIFGGFAACAVGALIIMIHSPVSAFWFAILFFAIQQLEGNLIYPRVVGRKIGLPPMLVLVAVTLGGGMFGIFGMLLFIPLFSVIYTLFCEHTERKASKYNIK